MRDEAAEVPTYNAVPRCAFSLVELLLDILGNVLGTRDVNNHRLDGTLRSLTFSMLYFFIAS